MLLTEEDLGYSEFEESIRCSIGGVFAIYISMGSSTWEFIWTPIALSIRGSVRLPIEMRLRNVTY